MIDPVGVPMDLWKMLAVTYAFFALVLATAAFTVGISMLCMFAVQGSHLAVGIDPDTFGFGVGCLVWPLLMAWGFRKLLGVAERIERL